VEEKPLDQLDFDEKFLNRLWEKIDVKSDDDCWIWKGKIRNNLPIIYYYNDGYTDIFSVKRIVYEMNYKINVKNKKIKQLCNNILCCNPSHLFVATFIDDDERLKNLKFIEYFWNKVNKSNDSQCWNWLGDTSNTGHGIFFVYNEHGNSESISASHFAYKLSNNYNKPIKKIYYKCGNKLCCNPKHLSINKTENKFILNEKQLKRFWSKVIIKGLDDCWEWKNCKNQKGYGSFYFDKKLRYAHRVSYFLSHGQFDESLFVLHHCDNPSCVNPNHLFLGTIKENSDDMILKGRDIHPKGSDHPSSKLIENDILKIVELINENYNYADIANVFNVGSTTINNIAQGFTWKHVPRPIFKRGKGFKGKKMELK